MSWNEYHSPPGGDCFGVSEDVSGSLLAGDPPACAAELSTAADSAGREAIGSSGEAAVMVEAEASSAEEGRSPTVSEPVDVGAAGVVLAAGTGRLGATGRAGADSVGVTVAASG